MMKPLRLFYAFFVAFALIAAPVGMTAYAAGDAKESNSNKTIDLSGLVLPVEQDGKLINYLFVSAMVSISSKYDHWEVRENAHVYRDKILKEAHRHPVGLDGYPMRLDEDAFRELMDSVFDEMLGPESIESIEIMAVDSQKVFLDG